MFRCRFGFALGLTGWAAAAGAVETAAPCPAYLRPGSSGNSPGQNAGGQIETARTRLDACTLNMSLVNPGWGTVSVEPRQKNLTPGAPVTLTAKPSPGRFFLHWMIEDAQHPGDANYFAYDPNISITRVMNADNQVTAVFKCGSGGEAVFPGAGVALLTAFMVRRRR
jgi:hypothetical protein